MAFGVAFAVLATATTTRTPQVVRLRDAKTRQLVSLVGTVHYNPASIATSKAEVESALDKQNGRPIGAVVVESCESRWTRSLELDTEFPIIKYLVRSEMQGAAGVALKNDVPVMLGDADVGPFSERVKSLAKQSALDLINPFGGWQRIFADLSRTLPSTIDTRDVAQSELLLEGEAPLSLRDFARFDIAIGFISSLVRYPAAFALKAPIPFALFAAFLFALTSTADSLDTQINAAIDASLAAGGGGEELAAPVLATVGFLLVQASANVLLARLLLVAFLEERNAELARSIRRAASERRGPVVAVLGGLHVNGVARLLMETDVPSADGRENDGVWWQAPDDLATEEWI